MPRPNRLRELLNTGRPSLGTRLSSQWPTIVELVGLSGAFDYVEILAEYAPHDLFSLENLGRAIQLHELSGMIKVPQELRAYTAVRALASGIQNVLFADVRTVADAEECVRGVRAETPDTGGRRGVAMSRDVGVVLEVGSPEYVRSTLDTVVALMIEKKPAVEDLDRLLDVPGVDMVQFGPADYAMSIGLAGQWQHPAVREAERFVIETALEKGIAPRVEIDLPADAEPYLELGVRHFNLATDVEVLYTFYKQQGSRLRDMLRDG
jgi:2-keto-3-deoxy-L-rhamnonate aldolase RhmA